MPDPHNPGESTPEERFAQLVREKRESLGWSQEELARRVSEATGRPFHQTVITRMEKLGRAIRLNEAALLAKILDIEVGELAQRIDDPSEDEQSLVTALDAARNTLTQQDNALFRVQEEMGALTNRYARLQNQVRETHMHIEYLTALLNDVRTRRAEVPSGSGKADGIALDAHQIAEALIREATKPHIDNEGRKRIARLIIELSPELREHLPADRPTN